MQNTQEGFFVNLHEILNWHLYLFFITLFFKLGGQQNFIQNFQKFVVADVYKIIEKDRLRLLNYNKYIRQN